MPSSFVWSKNIFLYHVSMKSVILMFLRKLIADRLLYSYDLMVRDGWILWQFVKEMLPKPTLRTHSPHIHTHLGSFVWSAPYQSKVTRHTRYLLREKKVQMVSMRKRCRCSFSFFFFFSYERKRTSIFFLLYLLNRSVENRCLWLWLIFL